MPRDAGSGLATVILLLAVAGTASAQSDSAVTDTTAARPRYTLFHRTPPDQRRPLTTDRPDRTESPYTVPAGLFQMEIDLFAYRDDGSADGTPGVESQSFAVAPINMKAGLLPNMDLQLVLETWATKTVTEGGASQRERGLGSITVRTKVNLWGNDAGRTAFALMPFVAFVADPGASRRLVNYGLVMPLSVDLGAGWSFSTMAELDLARESRDDPYHVAVIASASVGHGIVGNLSFYVEGYGGTVLADESSAWETTGDVGLTLGVGKSMQFDAGINLGFGRLADDVNPFLGFAFRF